MRGTLDFNLLNVATLSVALAMCQVLNGYARLVATALDSAALFQSIK